MTKPTPKPRPGPGTRVSGAIYDAVGNSVTVYAHLSAAASAGNRRTLGWGLSLPDFQRCHSLGIFRFGFCHRCAGCCQWRDY